MTNSAPRIARWAPSHVQLDGLVGGSLAIEDGCLMLRGQNGAHLLVLPQELGEWGAERQTLTLNGRSYGLGDTLVLAGGSIGRDDAPLSISRSEIPECGDETVLLAWGPAP